MGDNKKKISLVTYIISLMIMLLIIIALVIYIIQISKQSEENKNLANQIENTYSANQRNNAGNMTATSKNNQQGEELDFESEQVKEIIKKINFPRSVEERIYKNGNFKLDNIPNDLILKMAWSQINDADKAVEYNPEKQEIVTKEKMEKYIKEIFGSSIIYEDASFTIGDINGESYSNGFSVKYADTGDSDGEIDPNEYIVKYDDEKEKYIASGNVVSGLHWDDIVEQVDKVIKTDNKIEVYVKTGFFEERYDVAHPMELGAYSGPFYYIYKDFEGEKVVEYCNEGLSLTEDIIEKLNTYVYTFEYDEEDGNYYLNRFCAESEETSSKQENKNEKREVVVPNFYFNPDCPTCDKPIIYLYPENETKVTVKLGKEENLLYTYPKYQEQWNVIAMPNGDLFDITTGRNLYALYWEGKNTKQYNNEELKEGFCVKGEDTIKFLEEKLEILGLNERETEEFIIYWLPRMEGNKYNYIRFQTQEEIEENMPLVISPKPDTVIRVMMEFKPLDEKIELKEQKLEKTNREGFIVVEWGGTEIN